MKTSCSIALVFFLLLSSTLYSQTAKEYFNSGLAKWNLQNYNGAIADYTKSIEINPIMATSYLNRGIAKCSLQDFQGAISDFTKTIEINPLIASCYLNRGCSKGSLKDFQGAIFDFTKAIEINPNYALSYYNRGFIKESLKDFQGAISDYNKSIEINPKLAVAYSNRGLLKIKSLGQKESGCIDLNKSKELGNVEANEAINKYCQKKLQEQVRSFQANGKTFDIPESKADAFISDMPEAKEIQSYVLGKDTFEIPIKEVIDFMKVAPDAKPLNSYNFPPKWEDGIDIVKTSEAKPLNNHRVVLPSWDETTEIVDQPRLPEATEFVPPEALADKWLLAPPERKLKLLYDYLLAKNPELKDGGFVLFSNDMKDESNLKQIYYGLAKKYPKWKAIGYDSFKKGMFSDGGNEKLIKPKEKIQKKQLAVVDSKDLHSQIDKIKVGDTFIELPIPNGFVKVDDKMGVLLESAKKLCPNTNTLLAYYISEEDYANFLVNQDHLVQKYILVEVYNNFKNINVGNKDYRQFIKSFKEKHVEEFKQLYDEAGQIATENLSNLDAKLKIENFKMRPFGICYESKNSISFGALTKYNYTIENERSEDFIVAGISTITKIENKPIFLMLNKSYYKNEDITLLKTINSEWIKEIDKRQSPVSFLANIDLEDYKETILAILTLSIIWAIFIATKKIHRNIVIKKASKNIEKEEFNDFVDFDELLVEETLPIESVCIEPEKIQKNFPIINPELLKVDRGIRAIHALIDLIIVYLVAYCIGYAIGFLMGYSYAGNMINEHPYLYGLIVTFIAYFSQEFIFGKTLGKLITGTHVVNNLGKKPTTWQLIIRTLSRLIPLDGLSFLTSDKRGWHDTISSTYVIKD